MLLLLAFFPGPALAYELAEVMQWNLAMVEKHPASASAAAVRPESEERIFDGVRCRYANTYVSCVQPNGMHYACYAFDRGGKELRGCLRGGGARARDIGNVRAESAAPAGPLHYAARKPGTLSLHASFLVASLATGPITAAAAVLIPQSLQWLTHTLG